MLGSAMTGVGATDTVAALDFSAKKIAETS